MQSKSAGQASREDDVYEINDPFIHLASMYSAPSICWHKDRNVKEKAHGLVQVSLKTLQSRRVGILSAKPLQDETQILKQHLQLLRWFWEGTSLCYFKSWVASTPVVAMLALREIW